MCEEDGTRTPDRDGTNEGVRAEGREGLSGAPRNPRERSPGGRDGCIIYSFFMDF